MDVKLIMISIM